MAGSNQLVISVGANTDKLRADLALAQADVTAFGKELRTAAAEARDTGDYSKVTALAGKYEDARKSVLGLNQEIRNSKEGGSEAGPIGWLATAQAAFGRMQTAMGPVKEGLSDLHTKALAFGNAISNTASSIFPHFRDVLAIGAIGGAAGFISMVEKTAAWGHELQQATVRLGLTTTEMGSLKDAARGAGVEMEHLLEGVSKFGVNFQKAAEEQQKGFIALATHVDGARSLAANGIADITKGSDRGGAQILQVAQVNADQFKEKLTAAYNVLQRMGQAPAGSVQQWLTDINISLGKSGAEALKTREELAKIGIDIPAKTVGEALARTAPGFTDVFTKMKIAIFQTNGEVRRLYDGFGDFADRIKTTESASERLRLVNQTMGRGYSDLIPLLAKGRENLDAVAAALRAKGVNTSEFDEQIKEADKLFIALRKLDGVMAALRKSFVLPFVGVFEPLVDSLEKGLESQKGKIREFAVSIATSIKPIAEDFGRLFKGEAPQTGFVQFFVGLKQNATSAIGYIQSGFEKLMGILDKIAGVINSVFGTNFSGRGILIALAIAKITGALSLLTAGLGFAAAAIKVVQAALVLIYANPVTITIAAIAAAALLIYANWDKIAPLFQKIWDLIQQVASYIGGAFVSAWNTAVEGIKSAWTGLTTWISGQIDQIISVVNKIVDVAKQAAGIIAALGGGSAASSAGTGGGYSGTLGGAAGGTAQYASGGYITGPGTGTSDSILARVSSGEHITKAAAVSHYGVGFFHALNNMQIPKFSMGGLVGAFSPSLPSFAGGGLVGGGSFGTVNLTLGGQTASLNVSNADGFGQLSRIARSEQRTSAGAKPSWYGS